MVGNFEGHPSPGGNLLGYLGPEPSKRPCSLCLTATAVLQGPVCQNPTAGTTSDLGPSPISASQVSRPRAVLALWYKDCFKAQDILCCLVV